MCTYSKAVTCLTAASLWVIGFWLKQICLFAIFAQPKANFNFCRYAVNHMQLLHINMCLRTRKHCNTAQMWEGGLF